MPAPQPDMSGHRTSDLYFAAYLRTIAIPFVDTDRVVKEGKSKVWFIFEDMGSQVMREHKRQFFSGQATVSAMELVQSIKWAKTLTHME